MSNAEALNEALGRDEITVAVDALRSIAAGEHGPDGALPTTADRLSAAQSLIGYAHMTTEAVA